MAAREKPRQPAVVQAEIERLLREESDDRTLRERLETLTKEPGFHGVPGPVWAPVLYRRNRIIFRPFLVTHLAPYTLFLRKWHRLDWTGNTARALEPLLAQVDKDGDVVLFRKLYAWKLGLNRGDRKGATSQWRKDLVERLRAANSPADRRDLLMRFDLALVLDEDTALEIYALTPEPARRFIPQHLPRSFWGVDAKRKMWMRLHSEAERRGDDDLALELYRRQIPIEDWRFDIKRLCRETPAPDALVEALEKRHPAGWWVKGIGRGLHDALQARGRDVFPYVVRHLRTVWRSFLRRENYDDIVALALQRGWYDLWAETLRACGTRTEFDDAVLELLQSTLSDQETKERLALLGGVSRELNFGPLGLAQVHTLSDATAVTLYGRFPDLLRGVFKPHVGARWGESYPRLVERALAENDEELVDYLASRAAIRVDFVGEGRQVALAEQLSRYYESLLGNAQEFSRRAANVLTKVPPFSLYMYGRLVRANRLARLLFERTSETYLADPRAIRDLLEAPEIHVQALAYRALGADDARAKEIAAANVDLLQATLLRPLHRRTRRLAFAGLANAASDVGSARIILERARQAMDLPDKRYDKEALIGLMGQILHRWPELRGTREHPEVRREAVTA
jgi:hypothetical protein